MRVNFLDYDAAEIYHEDGPTILAYRANITGNWRAVFQIESGERTEIRPTRELTADELDAVRAEDWRYG